MARYDETRFRGTHNSYSGGARGSIEEQLDGGVRVLELDFHARGFASVGDFRIGHLKPGMQVARGHGNPDSLLLRDWLDVVSRWSKQHVHAPIAIVLDSKDDLLSPDNGDPDALNRTLLDAFGARLFTRDDFDREGGWPETSDMAGRILAVLSGNGNTRASYRWTFGSQPAMAINASGDVVLVYLSTAGDLNAFLGRIGADGSIEWEHKTTYWYSRLPLSQPAVAVNGEGVIVAVHRFEPPREFIGSRLESVVGRIERDRRISWQASKILGIGASPRVLLEGNEAREVHSEGDGRRQVLGLLNGGRGQVAWGRAEPTDARLPAPNRATHGGTAYQCASDADGVIVCGPVEGAQVPVRFRQLLFVEEQKRDHRESLRDALFFGADARDRSALAAAAAPPRSQIVRAWGLDSNDLPCPAQVGATDEPLAAWYQDYTTGPAVAV